MVSYTCCKGKIAQIEQGKTAKKNIYIFYTVSLKVIVGGTGGDDDGDDDDIPLNILATDRKRAIVYILCYLSAMIVDQSCYLLQWKQI